MTVRYTPMLSWLRLMQNWFDNPRLARACDEAGPAAATGWLVAVSRSLNLGGRFGDESEVARALRVGDIGLDRALAESLAPVLIRAGLILPAEQGFIIADLDAFIPRDNALAPQARPEARALRALFPGSSPGVTEGGREGLTRGGSESGVGTAKQAVTIHTDENGYEYAVLPPVARATNERCSHGIPWTWHPDGVSADGQSYPGFYAAQHRLGNGDWCKDRRGEAG